MHNQATNPVKDIKVDDLIGKRWELGAEGPDAYDCLTLVREAARRAGIDMKKHPSIAAVEARSEAIELGKADYLPLDSPEPFCGVTFRTKHPDYVSHMGFVLADGCRFIHIMIERRVVIERLDKPIWRKKLDGFYRFPG